MGATENTTLIGNTGDTGCKEYLHDTEILKKSIIQMLS